MSREARCAFCIAISRCRRAAALCTASARAERMRALGTESRGYEDFRVVVHNTGHAVLHARTFWRHSTSVRLGATALAQNGCCLPSNFSGRRLNRCLHNYTEILALYCDHSYPNKVV